MKLLICDGKKVHSFHLPNKIDHLYAINFDYYIGNTYCSEIINIYSNNQKLMVYSDNNASLRQNNRICSSVVLVENAYFEIRYADIPYFIPVYIIPDFCQYYEYSILNASKIDIGSSVECEIRVPNFTQLSCSIVKNDSDYYVVRKDRSLCYLNKYLFESEKLNLGDVIFINGIILIFMKNFIILYPFLYQIVVNNLTYIEVPKTVNIPKISPVSDVEKNVKLYQENQLFVYSPRIIQKIDEINFTFDLPPQKEEIQKTPMIFTMGLSAILTMISLVNLITCIRNYLNEKNDSISFIIETVIFGLMLIIGLIFPYETNKCYCRYN